MSSRILLHSSAIRSDFIVPLSEPAEPNSAALSLTRLELMMIRYRVMALDSVCQELEFHPPETPAYFEEPSHVSTTDDDTVHRLIFFRKRNQLS